MDFDLLDVAEGEWSGRVAGEAIKGEAVKAAAAPMAAAVAEPTTIRADGRVAWRLADGPEAGAARGAAGERVGYAPPGTQANPLSVGGFLPLRQMQQSVS